MKKLLLGLATIAIASQSLAQATLEDRISELEATNSLNIFEFNGTLETRHDSLNTKETKPTAFSEETVDYWRTKASLGVNAKVSEKIKFYSRLTASKFSNPWIKYNNGAGAAPETFGDANIAKDEQGAQLYFEKAYADVTVADTGTVFSFGRLPISDGPPFHMPHGRARMGTYPGLIYNAQLDGIAYTYNRPMDGSSLSARVVYSPFTSYAVTDGKAGGNGILASPRVGGAKSNTTINLTTAMVEYSNSKLGFVNNLNVILQTYQTGKLGIHGSDLTVENPFAPGTTMTGDAATTVDIQIGANALHLDLEGVGGTDLDLSATYLQSTVKNAGCVKFASLAGACGIYGFGAASADQSISGSSTLFSAKFKVVDSTSLGVEYLNGGDSVFIYDQNNDPLTGFYSTPGTGTHFYVLHKFTSELGLRIGMMSQEYKKTPFTFGASKDTDRKIATTYANIRLDF